MDPNFNRTVNKVRGHHSREIAFTDVMLVSFRELPGCACVCVGATCNPRDRLALAQ